MRITELTIFKLSIPTGQEIRDLRNAAELANTKKSWLLLKLSTDSGINGWGEGSGEWIVPAVEACLVAWRPLLIGTDPLNVAALTEDISDRLPWKGGPVFGTAIAAISMALYDIAGKAWNVPVHTILGGKRRDKVRVYTGAAVFNSPAHAVHIAQEVKARGFAGVKGNPLEHRAWPMDGSAVEMSVSCVKAIREAVGSEFDIMLDCHGSPQPELSLEFARQCAPFRPLFLEEPVKVGSIDALLEVSRKSPTPLAVGEKLFHMDQFLPLIEKRACSFLQPDISHCFGITQFMEIAAAARRQQMLMAPHMAGGPVFYAATLAAVASIPNFLIQETNYFELFDSIVDHDWRISDGHVNVSDAPGLGVTVKEQDLLKTFPYEPMAFRQYRHADGSWKGW